jgi:putative oxidoreductase
MARTAGPGVKGLAALLGVVLIGSGLTKLIGESHQAAMFAMVGLPVWFRLLVGTFEIIGGILLALPVSAPVGSLILSTIMVGALWTHAVHGEWRELVPVSVLLALLLLIFHRNQTRAVQLLGGA